MPLYSKSLNWRLMQKEGKPDVWIAEFKRTRKDYWGREFVANEILRIIFDKYDNGYRLDENDMGIWVAVTREVFDTVEAAKEAGEKHYHTLPEGM